MQRSTQVKEKNSTEKQEATLNNGNKRHPGFPKGKSGNPNGKPKGTLNHKTIYARLLGLDAPKQLLDAIKDIDPNAKTLSDVLAISTFNRALKGNSTAMGIIHNYVSGRPVETLALEQSTPIVLKYVRSSK